MGRQPLDLKETYGETLDMGFDFLRLSAYWYQIETVEHEYNYMSGVRHAYS